MASGYSDKDRLLQPSAPPPAYYETPSDVHIQQPGVQQAPYPSSAAGFAYPPQGYGPDSHPPQQTQPYPPSSAYPGQAHAPHAHLPHVHHPHAHPPHGYNPPQPPPPPGVYPYQQPAGPPQQGYYPGYQSGAPIGYQPGAAPPGYQPIPQSTSSHPKPSVVIVGGCPACRVGVLEDDFTCLGVCCAIFFFPLGILCCLAMRQRRCPNCGASFS